MTKNDNSKFNSSKKFLVTSALPYANGDIHLGHLVEVVQTDMFVRFQKMKNNDVLYVCADDTHGTPVELSAIKRGITPEQLVNETWKNHTRDYKNFSIDFDIFYTTNSKENKYYAELIYKSLKEKGLIVEREIEQFFDEKENRFLPDRFIKGTCPKCGAEDQYGDVCEVCSATYDPTELVNPKSGLSGETPVLKKSTHFFVDLAQKKEFLESYINKDSILQKDMRNFVAHWIDDGLKEWCISRDGPYFGFEIPGTKNKYFYVWLDAPVGYLSSTAKWCSDNNKNLDDYWGSSSDTELIHFIGKDIVYFHALFWPVMLDASGYKLPQRMFVHGFLTINGEKMSKTRGTFILANDFIKKVKHPMASQYLRFYYATKLSNNSSDLDLNLDEFCTKVNTTLANNIGNFHHRTFVFLDRFFESKVPDCDWDENLNSKVNIAISDIEHCYNNAEYKTAVEKIHALASVGNKYYQDTKPWELVKTNPTEAQKVMVTCVNLVRTLAVFLKPIIPDLIAPIEKQFGSTFSWSDSKFSIRNMKMGKTEKLIKPIEISELDALINKPKVNKEQSKDSLIDISDFDKIDLRIGLIKQAEKVKKSNKLLKLQIDDGENGRQIVAGIANNYSPEELIGKKIAFIANLKPVMLMGEKSEGMVLAAKKGKKMVILEPESDIGAGAKIA